SHKSCTGTPDSTRWSRNQGSTSMFKSLRSGVALAVSTILVALGQTNGAEPTPPKKPAVAAAKAAGAHPIQIAESFSAPTDRKADRKKKEDTKLLAEVALSYQHTRAGAEATDLLGTYYLDRGEYATADRCFAELLGHHRAAKLKPITLFRAALAFRHANDRDN